ncbi:MAG TPA: fructosamine kinase family protein [Alphaproteobacteria bacterium]|jgi:fructosamine-3-kinase|nr:fructosamine kinase family protein [Alphaproteobacteria bacterium]
MITPQLQEEIEKAIGGSIVAIAPLSAANNAQIYRLLLDGGRMRVAKVAERGMEVESWMLRFLKESTSLPVPEVEFSNDHVIIMEFVESHDMIDYRGQRHAAEQLAALHFITAEQYGLERDTVVGSLRQPNKQSKNWIEFFAEQRLLYMVRAAFDENKIDKRMVQQAEKLAGKLPELLHEPAAPSLVHGDVWGGNIIIGRGKIEAFLDPAIYFADPEVELAFIRLFNTFDDSFFARYNDISPIKPGFHEERADIYNLYPLLVHTRLFGASYARKAQKIFDKFV